MVDGFGPIFPWFSTVTRISQFTSSTELVNRKVASGGPQKGSLSRLSRSLGGSSAMSNVENR